MALTVYATPEGYDNTRDSLSHTETCGGCCGAVFINMQSHEPALMQGLGITLCDTLNPPVKGPRVSYANGGGKEFAWISKCEWELWNVYAYLATGSSLY